MQVLYDENSVAGLALCFLSGVILVYLHRTPARTRPSRSLYAAFSGMTVFFAARTLTVSTSWHPIFFTVQVLAIVFTAAMLARFAYQYPEDDRPTERRRAAVFYAALGLGTLAVSASYVYWLWQGVFPAQMPASRQFFDLVLPFSLLVTVAILLHRAAGQSVWQVLRSPQQPAARTLRDFTVALLLAFVPALADPLNAAGWLSETANNYMINLGLLCMMLAFFITYLNHGPEPSTLSAKLVLLTLGAVMAVVSYAGMLTVEQMQAQFERDRLSHVWQARQALAGGQLGALPPQIHYILARPLQTAGPAWVLYQRSDLPALLFANPDELARRDPQLFAPLDENQRRALLAQPEGAYQQVNHVLKTHPLALGEGFHGYRFTQGGLRYEVGLNRSEYARHIHEHAVRLMYLVLASGLFVLWVFPLFFRANVLAPLDALLTGVRLAVAGKRDVYVAPQREDEVGYLTRSFNTLVNTIQQTEEALRQANAGLEQRVRQRTAELAQSEEKYRNVIERSNDSILIIQDWRIRFCNPQLAQLTGYPHAGLIERPFLDLVAGEDHERLRQRHERRLRGEDEPSRYETILLHKNGQRIDIEINAGTMEYQGEPAVLVVAREIGERKRTQAQLEQTNAELRRLSTTDALTGLYNRRHFFELAQAEFERARRHHLALSVLMIDIDHFKHINDSCGHLTGDQTLQAVARLCQQMLREHDVLGRYGGEEFAVLLPETRLDGALDSAERLRTHVHQVRHELACLPFAPTISVGVANLSEDTPSLETLLDRADQALYRAKQGGRNRSSL